MDINTVILLCKEFEALPEWLKREREVIFLYKTKMLKATGMKKDRFTSPTISRHKIYTHIRKMQNNGITTNEIVEEFGITKKQASAHIWQLKTQNKIYKSDFMMRGRCAVYLAYGNK